MIHITNKLGEIIPSVGLGTFPLEGKKMASVVESAVSIGYRLIDTSDDYRGESGIGEAIQNLSNKGFSRENLFLQTKISDNNAHDDEPLKGIFFNKFSRFMQRHSVEEIVREKVNISLRNMHTDYLDSLLIHYPFPDFFVEIWKVLIELKKQGVVRYIGVSNFHKRHIEMLISETGICPEINEVYVSPIGIKKDLIDFCNGVGCLIMAYSPLIDLVNKNIPCQDIVFLAKKYNKSLSQIVLRWNVERGCIPLPKTQNLSRLMSNFDIFDFSLTSEEVRLLSSLNFDNQYLVESKICPGI